MIHRGVEVVAAGAVDRIALGLLEAHAGWISTHDRVKLRRAHLMLLASLARCRGQGRLPGRPYGSNRSNLCGEVPVSRRSESDRLRCGGPTSTRSVAPRGGSGREIDCTAGWWNAGRSWRWHRPPCLIRWSTDERPTQPRGASARVRVLQRSPGELMARTAGATDQNHCGGVPRHARRGPPAVPANDREIAGGAWTQARGAPSSCAPTRGRAGRGLAADALRTSWAPTAEVAGMNW